MEREQKSHFETLKKTYQDRLRALEVQEARQGMHTPAEMITEIQETRAKIAAIDSKLNGSQFGYETIDREQRKTILVVDDYQDIRELVQDALEPEGYVVLTAKTGLEAVTIVNNKNTRVDLILSDMHMGAMSGYDLLFKMRDLKISARFVIMTGSSDFSDDFFKACMKMGATDYLPKSRLFQVGS
jgi:CheY-like chemotaxis protein